LFDRAIKEAADLNARGRRGAKTSTPQPTGKPAPKGKVDLSSFDKTKK
jgi:hypothetical protein